MKNGEHYKPIKQLITENDVFYGNDIILKNTGRIPATKVSTSYYITTDLDQANMNGPEWFEKKLGGFGGTSFIAPGAKESEPGLRSLSGAAEYYYWESLVIYEGLEQNKKYWTHVKKACFLDKYGDKVIQIIPVFNSGEWDRNNSFDPPRLSTKDEVMATLQKIKQRKAPTNGVR